MKPCLLWRKGACQAIWTLIMGGDSKFCVNKTIWQQTPRSLLWQLSNMTISSWVMRQNEPIWLIISWNVYICVNRKGTVIYVYFGLIYGLWLRVIVAFEARILFIKLAWRAGQLLHVGHWKLRESAWQERMVRSQQNFNNKILRNGKNTKKHSLFWQCLFSAPFARLSIGILVHWQRGYF